MAVAPALKTVPWIIVLGAVLVTASADLTRLAVLDVPAVLNGEVWRALTGHLAHLTWMQLAVDGPAFLLLWTLYRRMTDDRAVLQLTLGSALVVGLTVILVGRHTRYGGLSGLSSALLSAVLLMALLREPRAVMPYLLSAISLVYLFAGNGLTGVAVAQEAHMAGALAGLGMASVPFTHRVSSVSQTKEARMEAV
jgi:membrane associated rhomboid family serine protease